MENVIFIIKMIDSKSVIIFDYNNFPQNSAFGYHFF